MNMLRRRTRRHPFGYAHNPRMRMMMGMELEHLLMQHSRQYTAPVTEVRTTLQDQPPATDSQSQPRSASQPDSSAMEAASSGLEATGSEHQPMDTDSSSSGADATRSQNVTKSPTPNSSSVSQPSPSASTSADGSVSVFQVNNTVNVTLAGQLAGTSVAPAVAGPSTGGGVNLRSEQSGVPPPPAPVPSVVATDLVGSEGQSGGGSVVVSNLPGVQASSGSPPSGAKRTVSGSDEGSKGEQGGEPAAKEPRREGADKSQQEPGEGVQQGGEREDVKRLIDVVEGFLQKSVNPAIISRLRELPAEAVTVIIRELSYSFSDFGFPISFDDEDSDEVDMDVNVSPSEPGKFPLSDEQMLQRLLVLGGITAVRTGQYPKNHAPTDLTLINRMINSGQGPVVVHHMRDVSIRGRSNKQELLMYCLAMCCRSSDQETKKAGYAAIKEMCRTPTQIFQLIHFIEEAGESSGWGRGLRRVLCAWYNSYADNPLRLAMHMTKYWNRHGWCHRDVFRMVHIKPKDEVIEFLVCYAAKGLKDAEKKFLEEGYRGNEKMEKVHKYLKAVEEAKQTLDVDRTVALIKEHDLVREQLRTEMLNKPEVWSIMLPHMPLTALIRNLGKMTKLELFSNPEHVKTVVSKLTNVQAMKKARVHPFRLLVAQHIYSQGSGDLGSLRWTPHPEIVLTLEKAFYQSFDAVEPSNKRILIALDISSSMTQPLMDSPISCRQAATCMCMVTAKREPNCDIVGFHTNLIPLTMFKDPSKKLHDLIRETGQLGFDMTDCSKPMTWARKRKKEYDAFIIYTDSETNMHRIPPYAALEQYRKAMNIPTAKLVVVAMNTLGFTIARADDMHMLDVIGFDPDTPEMIRDFLVGGLD